MVQILVDDDKAKCGRELKVKVVVWVGVGGVLASLSCSIALFTCFTCGQKKERQAIVQQSKAKGRCQFCTLFY
jgi:hypothetical protein